MSEALMTSLSIAPDRFLAPLPELPVVFVIGSDISLHQELDVLAHSARWRTETVTSTSALLDQRRTFGPSCLVLDVSQLESDDLIPRQWPTEMPIICITTAGDVSLSVRAMKAGAADVLTKPVGSALLRDAVRLALSQSEKGLREGVELNGIRERYVSLSGREREVMALVVSGLMNKQVGGELGISEITVKAHRGRMVRKMKARSLPNLVIMAARLQAADVSSSQHPLGIGGWPNVPGGERQARPVGLQL
jgi:FixJ family two-component response regulator